MKKIVSIAVALFFTNQGYSQPESPVLEQACPRNVVLHINGVNHCMDTFPLYYPEQGDEGGLESLFMLHRSSIMKILGEEIWYNEKAEQDRIRILFIEYEPCYDSVRLYTFSDYHKDSIVQTRKMMLTYDYPGLWGEDDTVCYNTYKKRYNTANKKIDTIHYSTTRYFITGKEFRN